ncbi:hypothetical protein U0070_016533, partial [Myodes glareolus]
SDLVCSIFEILVPDCRTLCLKDRDNPRLQVDDGAQEYRVKVIVFDIGTEILLLNVEDAARQDMAEKCKYPLPDVVHVKQLSASQKALKEKQKAD